MLNWYRQIREEIPVTEIPITMAGVDERKNRVLLGVRDDAARERLRSRVSELGIPAEAVRIEIANVTVDL